MLLLEKYQDNITLSPGTIMKGIIMGICGRYSQCWATCWNNNNTQPEIAVKCLCTEVMKCNRSMKDCLIQARKKTIYSLVYKHKAKIIILVWTGMCSTYNVKK